MYCIRNAVRGRGGGWTGGEEGEQGQVGGRGGRGRAEEGRTVRMRDTGQFARTSNDDTANARHPNYMHTQKILQSRSVNYCTGAKIENCDLAYLPPPPNPLLSSV